MIRFANGTITLLAFAICALAAYERTMCLMIFRAPGPAQVLEVHDVFEAVDVCEGGRMGTECLYHLNDRYDQ